MMSPIQPVTPGNYIRDEDGQRVVVIRVLGRGVNRKVRFTWWPLHYPALWADTIHVRLFRQQFSPAEPLCRKCGCTDADCRGCIERTGEPCVWVEPDLCSACETET